jgi:hypothetical protein
MELPGVSYLYALATVSITFVGFSALLLVFRETIGSRMTGYDSYFMLSFMQAGFIVTAGGLLPQLLAFYDMSHTLVWQASSLIMAIPISCLSQRRPRGAGQPPRSEFPFTWGSCFFFSFSPGRTCCSTPSAGPRHPSSLRLPSRSR